MAGPQGVEERFPERGGKRKPLQADTTVAYPARGGFEEIMLALTQRLVNLRCGQKVVRIDPRRCLLRTQRGDVIRWSRLVSTIPIDRLLTMIPDVPVRLLNASRQLESLAVVFVLVVTRSPIATTVQRIYCAGPETPAHKIVLNHNSSPYLRSLPHHGILAEVSEPDKKCLCFRDLADYMVRSLLAMDLLESPASTDNQSYPRATSIPRADSRSGQDHRRTQALA